MTRSEMEHTHANIHAYSDTHSRERQTPTHFLTASRLGPNKETKTVVGSCLPTQGYLHLVCHHYVVAVVVIVVITTVVVVMIMFDLKLRHDN